jgi:hypothetical protein
MKAKALVPFFLFLCTTIAMSQTFMIVAVETRDGEQLERPFASQEGIIEGMFDSGMVSFDTGVYAPAMDWRRLEFREPLDIARQGLAGYLLAADVQAVTTPRDLATAQSDAQASEREPLLKIDIAARYYLFEVHTEAMIGRGEMSTNNESPEKQQLSYTEFLHSVGRDIAVRGIALLKGGGG